MGAGRCAPDSAAAIHGTSATFRVKKPSVSSEAARGCTPRRSNIPKVGLYPTAPQNEAGRMTEPAVCDPSAAGTIRSATAAADPLEDPPGVRPGSCGLRVFPPTYAANSVVTVLPMITAPAART